MKVLQNGKWRELDDIRMVDSFLEKASKRPMWDVIDFMVNAYSVRFPGVVVRHQKSLHNRYAANKDKDLRHLIQMPQNLYDLIYSFYGDEIESNKKKFLREFAKRYKIFSPAEAI